MNTQNESQSSTDDEEYEFTSMQHMLTDVIRTNPKTAVAVSFSGAECFVFAPQENPATALLAAIAALIEALDACNAEEAERLN